jgi:hypothetical protein
VEGSSGKEVNRNMADPQTRRIKPAVLSEDVSVLEALQGMTTYAPANAAYALDKLQAAQAAMQSQQSAETQAEAAFKAARDDAAKAEWAFHNAVLGAKEQVIAQFGKDSNEVQAIGLKKKSERKTLSRAAQPAMTPAA